MAERIGDKVFRYMREHAGIVLTTTEIAEGIDEERGKVLGALAYQASKNIGIARVDSGWYVFGSKKVAKDKHLEAGALLEYIGDGEGEAILLRDADNKLWIARRAKFR